MIRLLQWAHGIVCVLFLYACMFPAQEKQGLSESIQTQNIYEARVIKIVDGDTIHVLDKQGHLRKLRLAYIDAPEITQKFGKKSRQVLQDLLAHKQVLIKIFEKDRYQREVAQIILKGDDVNLLMLRKGMAWHYISIAKKKQKQQDIVLYMQAEQLARQQKIGLWKDKTVIAPWNFRKQRQ